MISNFIEISYLKWAGFPSDWINALCIYDKTSVEVDFESEIYNLKAFEG